MTDNLPKEIDDFTVVGPMSDYINSIVGAAHAAHLEELKNGGWPDPEAYKRVIRQARENAIASFTGQSTS